MVPPSWLEECVSERAHVNPKVYKHRFTMSGQRLKDCKALNKDTISSTGFDLEERNLLQRQVEVLGGCFDSQLCRDTCTVLIAKTPVGKKYDSARQWNITVASQTWLRECILRGARADPSRLAYRGLPCRVEMVDNQSTARRRVWSTARTCPLSRFRARSTRKARSNRRRRMGLRVG